MLDRDYSENKTVIIALLGLIIFISFIAGETSTDTFKILLFFFVILLLPELWKKIDKRIQHDGLDMTFRRFAGHTWRIGVVIFSLVALFKLLSWYMDNPLLVKTGGTIAYILLALMGIFLVVSLLYALISVLIEQIRKKAGKIK